jgi:hypothetical protein
MRLQNQTGSPLPSLELLEIRPLPNCVARISRATVRWWLLMGVAIFLTAGVESGQAETPAIDFSRDILPILSDHCFHCHGPDEQSRAADLSLHTAAGVFEREEPAIVRGDSQQSLLVQRIMSDNPDEVMPPPEANRRLNADQIARLRRWIDEGAAWGKHWAYEPPQRPAVPGQVHPIDYFIDQRLQAEGLAPAAPATRESWLRRVTLDLTGLPPTLEEIDAFLGDRSDRAEERVVERLLQSPRFGQRMAWDWLDAARYADTNGFQGDPERTMWPWRDWVVAAFNANMPYDRFTLEQLAGDLLAGATHDQQLASAFHRNNMHNGEGGRIAEETRVENVFDRVETTATLWLGATFTCCRCHDHKYDPFTLRDYYGFYDIFNQMSETGQGRGGQAAPVLDMSSASELQQVKATQATHQAVAKEVDAYEAEHFQRDEAGEIEVEGEWLAHLPKNRGESFFKSPARARLLSNLIEVVNYLEAEKIEPDYLRLLKRLIKSLRERDAAANRVTKVMIMDQLPEPRDTFVLSKGAYDKPTDIQVLGGMPVSLLPPGKKTGEGERATRLELAHWLTSPENPLMARVTVNRYWQMFFGTGLVKTVEDFGVQGERPTHPELLDWLACEFRDGGWDLKALCKWIVLSQAYRRSSQLTAAMLEKDPDNRWLARGPRYRLPSWMLRDTALAVSGLLVDSYGGPSVKPYQPEGIWEEATFGKKSYVQDHGDALYRRTLYTYWRRIVGPTMLFDNAARQTCTVKSFRTNTPLHALTTLNDIAYVEAARGLGQRMMLTKATPEERVEYGFRLVTARRPRPEELQILVGRLEKLREDFGRDPEAAARLLAVGESPRDLRLEVSEHAAYASLGSLLLNLDEALSKE